MSFFQKLGSFFQKLGFEKSDERAVLIGAYSLRITALYTTIFLFVWTVVGFISTGRLGIQSVAFFSSQAVYWFSYGYYQKKFGG